MGGTKSDENHSLFIKSLFDCQDYEPRCEIMKQDQLQEPVHPSSSSPKTDSFVSCYNPNRLTSSLNLDLAIISYPFPPRKYDSPYVPSVSKILQSTMPKEQEEILKKWEEKMIREMGLEAFVKYKEGKQNKLQLQLQSKEIITKFVLFYFSFQTVRI